MTNLKFLFLLFPFLCFAQYEKEMDSLYKIIGSNVRPELKVEPYGQLIEMLFEIDPAQSPKKIQELYRLNQNNSCPKCETMADFYTGSFNDINGNPESAARYYEKAAQKSLPIKDYEFYQLAKTFKIYTYFNMGDLANAERELADYFKITKRLKLTTGYEEMYYVRGLIQRKKGYFNTAIADLLQADKIIVDAKLNKMKLRVNVLSEIALTYKDLNNYDKAIEYLTKSENQSRKNQDQYGEMNVQLIRGRIENAFQHYQQAIGYLERANAYFKSIRDNNYAWVAELQLGISKYHLRRFQQSIGHLKSAADGLKKNASVDNYALALAYLAKNNLVLDQPKEAKNNIALAKSAVAGKTDFPFYGTILDAEIDYYKKTNNHAMAFKSISQKDSLAAVIAQKSNISSLNEFEAKYQNEKKQSQIELLLAQKELAQKQKYIVIGLLLLLLLSGMGVFYVFKNKIKTAQKIHELNQLKSRFFANISHEFRTPLTLIKSPVQSLHGKIKDENQLRELSMIGKNADRMLELVDQLLELSKIDSGHLQLIFKEGNLATVLAAIVEPYEFQAREKNLTFISSIQKTPERHSFDKDVIEKIATNLLNNAIKYAPENATILCNALLSDSRLILTVSNTGSDVRPENISKLFERFYQTNAQNQGVGIGLALVKELVDLYQGTIETRVENGKLSFTVSLPLAPADRQAVVIESKNQTESIQNTATETAELPVLLIVDDHADIRQILKEIFSGQYSILEAQDGEQACDMAQKEIPDCILSDVMMPKMDGFTFTKSIKENELTSFIPVVLLTAKTSDQAHLDGLQSTADAFLTKPFNHEIVKATVNQLIAERKKLHARYSQELVLKPVDIVVNSMDQKFIAKLQLILERELANADFTSEDFAAAADMSRMQLHRKLKALLGVSATEFIRNERLKVAAELIKKGNANISEIAYSAGFNNISYFSRCFKEMFSITPSEYMSANHTS